MWKLPAVLILISIALAGIEPRGGFELQRLVCGPLYKISHLAVLMLFACFAGNVMAQSERPRVLQNKPMVQPVKPPKPQKPIRTETRTFDNWTVTCEEYARTRGKQICSAALKIVDRKSRRTLFAWLLARQARSGRVVGLVQTPTGILIEPGIIFRFAAKNARKFSFTSCEPGRCSTVIPLGLAMRKEISRAKIGVVTIKSTAGQLINFKIALKGFAEAYAAVSAVK